MYVTEHRLIRFTFADKVVSFVQFMHTRVCLVVQSVAVQKCGILHFLCDYVLSPLYVRL